MFVSATAGSLTASTLALRRSRRRYLATVLHRLVDPAGTRWALLAIVALGALLRVETAAEDLFADELATAWVVTAHGFFGVFETVASDAEISPPLSFALSWLSAKLGDSEQLLRLPSLLAGVLTIPLVYALGLKTVGRQAALLAAALTALSPFMIFYSAEARGYGLLMMLVVASTLSMLMAVDTGKRRWWVAYGAGVALATYTHYTGVFVLAAQLGWLVWGVPNARRRALTATGLAAVFYLPWLPSLQADLASPTTEILGALSPFDPASVKLSLGHWAVGFPYARVAPLRELPGEVSLVMLAAALLVALSAVPSMFTARLPAPPASRRILLVVILAAATAVAEAAVSLFSTNVFSTRNLAASWPYMALAASGVTMLLGRRRRLAVSLLAIAAFAIGAIRVTAGPDFARPDFSAAARFVGGLESGALVDAASFTPGPLANFDLPGTDPAVPVLRLTSPAQKTEPFSLADRLPDPSDVARRAVRAAGQGPIAVVTAARRNPIAGARSSTALVDEFTAALPDDYVMTDEQLFEGLLDLRVQVFRR